MASPLEASPTLAALPLDPYLQEEHGVRPVESSAPGEDDGRGQDADNDASSTPPTSASAPTNGVSTSKRKNNKKQQQQAQAQKEVVEVKQDEEGWNETSARVAELEEELERTMAEKEALGAQYRSLLGKLTTMRNTLGDKLRQDAVSCRLLALTCWTPYLCRLLT